MSEGPNVFRRSSLFLIVMVLICLLATGLLGCGSRTATSPQSSVPTPATSTAQPTTPKGSAIPVSQPTTPAAPPPATTPQVTTAVVYFARGEHLGVSSTRQVPAASPARAALEQLLAGPTSTEKASGLITAIPSGTKLRGIVIADGVATVDLTRRFESGGGTLSMSLRIGQVVKTLSQFSRVKRVAFKLDGKKAEWISGEGIMVWPPVKVTAYDDLLPAIMLMSPTPGATIATPVRLRGTANVFEAVFRVKITDAAGKVVVDKPITASSGTGTRGTFDASVPFKVTAHGTGWLTVYEPSAKDGSPTNVVKIRVRL